MSRITIPHTKDLTNELEELHKKVEQARISRRAGCAYKSSRDWGKFKYTNYTAVKYAGHHFVYQNRNADVTYFPIQKHNITYDRRNKRIRIACLEIDVPFETPPGFLSIQFIHIFHNYILVEYTEANDWVEFKDAMVKAAIESATYMEERDDEVDDEMRSLAIYKVKYVKRIIRDIITERRKNDIR